MGSGLIYAVIVGLWAVVLVPMWLRRHDDVAEVRQVDRFSTAMRILSRRPERESVDEERLDGEVDTAESVAASGQAPRPAVDPPVVLTGVNLGPRSRSVEANPSQVFVSRPRSAQRRREQAARRRNRQRILLGMVGVVLIAAGLAGFGAVGWWAPVAVLVASAGYVVVLRRQAVADERAMRESARQMGRPVVPAVFDAASFDSTASPQPAADVAEIVGDADATERVAGSPGDAEEQASVAWSPNSPPLPTYVTAPAATRVPRVIDREGLSGLTAERMVQMAEAARTASGIDASPADDDVWAEATADPAAIADSGRDAVFDREWFEADMERDGFAEVVEDEVENIVGEGSATNPSGRPRYRHPSHDEYRRASGA